MKRATQRVGLAAMLGVAVAVAGCFGDSPEQLIESAKSHIEKSDSKAAVIQLKNALQKNPNSAEARFLLGKLLLQGGDLSGAKIELGKAAELGYDKQLLAPVQAKLMLQQGQVDKVIEQYGQMSLADAKGRAELATTLAMAHVAKRNLSDARTSIDLAMSSDPELLTAQLISVRLLAAEQRKDEAFAAVDRLLAKHEGSGAVWQLKGDVQRLFGLGDEAAVASYQEAIKRDKNDVTSMMAVFAYQLGRGELDAAQGTLKQMQAVAPNLPQTRLLAARLALQRKDLKAAQEQVQQLLKLTPNAPAALQMAGMVASRQGEHSKAETYLKQALQAQPKLLGARLLLAQTYLRSGDGKKAIASLQDLLDEKSPNPQALAIAAEAHLLLGEAKQAEEYFARAVKLNPKDSRSRTALAVAQLGKGDGQHGLEELRALSGNEESVLPDMALISALVRRNEIDQALKAVDALERKAPDRPTAAALRGSLEQSRGNTAKARESYEAALKLVPGYMPALAALAKMDLAEKKPEQAAKRFEQVLQKEPQNVPAHMALFALRAQAGAAKQELVDRLAAAIKQNPQALPPRLALVKLQLDGKDAKAALSAAQDGVAAIADNVEMLGALAQAQMAAGDYNQAISAAGKAVALQPESPLPLLRLAELQMAHKDFDAATQSTKKALALKPDMPQVQALLVALTKQAGRLTEARSIVQGLQRQFSSSPLPLAMEGDLEAGEKNFAVAASAYRKALDKGGDGSVAIKLHSVLRAQGKADEAKRFEAQWQAKNPKDVGFIFYMADQSLAQGDLAQALGRYEAVLKLQPEHAAALNNVAWLLNKTGKPGALAQSQKALALQPKHPAFLDTQAEILATQGQLDKALEVQKQAVEVDPNFPMHRLHLAQYYVRAGKKSEAGEQLKVLAALGDKFPAQAEVKRLQASL